MNKLHLYRALIQPVPEGRVRPLWSVMIPTYNCADYLRETLKSVLAEDPGSELMQIEVVDDCSTQDDPEAVVEELGKGRVKFYQQPQNVGYIKNFETCLQRSQGQLIHLLHGDDCIRPGFYQKMQALFQQYSEIGSAFCRQIIMDDQGHWKRFSRLEQDESGILSNWLERIAADHSLQPPGVVVKREVYEKLGGFDCRMLSCGEDWEMWVRIAAQYPVAYEVEPLALYRDRSNSLTKRSVRTGQNIRDVRKATEIIKGYLPNFLPEETAQKLSNQALELWASWALNFAGQMIRKGDTAAALTQIQEALKCSRSLKVIQSSVLLALKMSKQWINQGLQPKLLFTKKESGPFELVNNSCLSGRSKPLLKQPTVALMSCGSLYEDFFEPLGVSFEKLRTEQTGGWMFNYIDALALVDVKTVLIFISAHVSQPLYFTHEPTGALVSILPSPFLHRMFRSLTGTVRLPGKRFIRRLDGYLVIPKTLLAQELNRQDCDVVLLQDYEIPSFDVIVRLGQQNHLPVFASFQGGKPACNPIEKMIRKVTISNCTGLIIGPQTEIARVQAVYGISSEKVARIFNPLDVENWQASPREVVRSELGIPLHAKVVICHGRIDITHKGLDILLEAWKQVCQSRSQQSLNLLLVGTGKDAVELQQRIDAMQVPGVLWINEYVRDRELIRRYLSAADIYTLPSRHEGFPVAPIEAMSCGLPIVATEVPGVQDILEEGEISGGLVVPREDPNALAQALGEILDNDTWRRDLGQRARKRAEQCFSLKIIGQQMRQFLFNAKHEPTEVNHSGSNAFVMK